MLKLIPEPNEIIQDNGFNELKIPCLIAYSSDLAELAKLIKKTLDSDWKVEFPTKLFDPKKEINQNAKNIKLNIDSSISTESYSLIISSSEIQIKGGSSAGAYYGFQTLRQIFFNYFKDDQLNAKVNCIHIHDAPRFSWRGFMLDEARYFLGKKAVLKILDWMGFLKLNRFHWHLTEDQGWRIEIKKYPELTKIGSKRNGTPKFRNINKGSDGILHQGYYSQAEIKEIIEYAKERFIEIVPEIEMPGHAQSALATFPELSCTGGTFHVSTTWGVHKDVFCIGNEKTIAFLKSVLEEIVELFPSPWIHIGGDEVPKDRWKNCEKCQSKIKIKGLTDEHHLQVDFTNEIVKFLEEKGKKSIVWNEVTDSRLDPKTITQFWRGKFDPIIDFLKLGGKTIISPNQHYYVDVCYESIPLSKTYNFEPAGKGTDPNILSQIMGVEAELWGEVFKNEKKMEFCAFPRTFAIAESGWTQEENKNFLRFRGSLSLFLDLWKQFGIDCASLIEAEPKGWQKIQNRFKKGFGHYL